MSLPEKYKIEPYAWINQLRHKRHEAGRDLKVTITSRNSTTGTGKTTLGIWLCLNWSPNFTADQATLHVPEFLNMYEKQTPGSCLLMDEAEQLDNRRSMRQENIEFSERWSMMRFRQVDTILTLPTVTALDSRLEELSDIWINVLERGLARVHLIKVGDYDKNVGTPPWHDLSFPDISHLDICKEIAAKKEQKIQGEQYGQTEDEKQKEIEEQADKRYQKRLAQRLRNEGSTLREIADDQDIDYSYQWVSEHTKKPE